MYILLIYYLCYSTYQLAKSIPKFGNPKNTLYLCSNENAVLTRALY